MAKKSSPQYVINSYQRKQKVLPVVIWVIGAIIIALGILLIILWFSGNEGSPLGGLFASKTPTPTETLTPTPTVPTSTPTITPTITLTPTPTVSPTPEGPQLYTVEEGDNCWYVAVEKFGVGMDLFLAINGLTMNNCNLIPGQEVIIPGPNTKLPTNTPIALEQFTSGQKITYEIELNDSLREIASKFNSTIESIMKLNNMTDENAPLKAGTNILISVNIVTPTPTPVATSTALP
jgi:LysM repeat protein